MGLRHQVQNSPVYFLIFFVCLCAIIVFYMGLVRAELAYAASRNAEQTDPAASVVSEVQAEPDDTQWHHAMDAPKIGVSRQDNEAAEIPFQDASKADAKEAQPYVTTAYYLNVRAESNARSKILKTVKKGTVLLVVDRLENGWLQLENEGFVHGAYAEPAGPAEAAGSGVSVGAGEKEPRVSVKSMPAREPGHPAKPVPLLLLPEDSKKPQHPEAAKPAGVSHEVISDSGLTKEDISEILEGTQLVGHGLEDAVLEVEEKYGINAYFTIAVMKLESGNGKSRLARVKNNLFGLNATGGNNEQAYSFETKADSVYRFGQLIYDKYVKKGLTTIEKVGRKYCPANEKWADLIVRIMKSDQLKV
jgi:flagellum-specific peptidoglycan hydrolase FlgJ